MRAIILILGSTMLMAQTAPEPSDTIIRSTSREVLLDVTVRQKNLQLARKLTAADFTITEDGIPQPIKAFRFISKDDPETAAPAVTEMTKPTAVVPTATGQVRRVEEPSFISIIFEQISPDSRKYARDAVMGFLNHELRASTYIGMFGLDNQISVLQSFTNDRTQLNRALDHASVGDYSGLTAQNSQVLNQADYTATGTRESGVGIGSSIDFGTTADLSRGGASVGLTEGAQAAAKITADQRDIAMYQGGMRTVMALLRFVKYEASLPGRKTVIYLSEGLTLPPGQHELIRNVISAANRGNISFYGIDVRGLSTFDANSLARNLATSNAGVSASQQHTNPTGVTTAMAKEDDTRQVMEVANTSMNMRELAEGTGGFAVSDTNEINKSMLRVMEDVRTHYEISYVPTSDIYDGHFRKIKVSVSNPKFSVQSRDGYYALPELNGKALQPYEISALQALDQKTPPKDFPFRASALRYRPKGDGAGYEIVFDVPITGITPKTDATLGRTRLHATFLALIKDSRGQVVDKVSHEIDEYVPADKLEQFKHGEMIFWSGVNLAPGRYTIDEAASDSEGNRASTRKLALFVARPADFTLSDVALVHDLEPLTARRDPTDPLQFAGGKITPELSGMAKPGEGASLYFVVYPGQSTGKPKVTIRYFKDGQQVASAEPELGQPDDTQSIPVLARAQLPAGEYEARVRLEEDGRVMQRSTVFTVGAP